MGLTGKDMESNKWSWGDLESLLASWDDVESTSRQDFIHGLIDRRVKQLLGRNLSEEERNTLYKWSIVVDTNNRYTEHVLAQSCGGVPAPQDDAKRLTEDYQTVQQQLQAAKAALERAETQAKEAKRGERKWQAVSILLAVVGAIPALIQLIRWLAAL